ncbi:hypothetical protein MX569_11010 [Anoxybacillus kestanbolensis]|jgi:hypothetical protein|uniref:Uncharacterized protein n=1 Tax=Geobacillus proteiniphilus TaxID=860353 RepID=A0A1Q5SNZ8_9BACL|nr:MULTISPECIES: hypothetical protein [Bacillaceae]MCL9971115.1 hypothetical protein [Anoxybacillus kestanbolensis]OKO89747.1 hypothetical protein BRO54_3298 [Geobacillus proteiniphilus]WMJ15979.1 hypothetical protein RA955_14905 [Geobacillus proteiniphilus]
MDVGELDVIRLKNGVEATVLEVYPTEPKYYCQNATDDDDMFYVTSEEIAEITYKCKST